MSFNVSDKQLSIGRGVTSDGCRPPIIPSTMSGTSSVSCEARLLLT